MVVDRLVWLGQAAAPSISRGILLGSMFYVLGIGHLTHSHRLACPDHASKKPFVTFETCVGGLGCVRFQKVTEAKHPVTTEKLP